MPVRRPDLNGSRVRRPGQTDVYLIDEGRKRRIPNRATYDNLFRDWNGIREMDISEIEDGLPIPDWAVLVRASGAAEVWLIDGPVKRHVTTSAVMDKYHFRRPASSVDPASVDRMPTGPPIS